MVDSEQLNQLKQQLIQHIESTFPEDKREQAIEQINSMNAEQLEQFLRQNNLIKEDGTPQETSSGQCIFCSIIEGHVQSYKIDENKDAIAILEINPISQGHTLIIPKEHILESGKIPQTAFSLAKKISKKLKTRFKPKEVKIVSSNLFGHETINIFPVFDNENLNSQRQQMPQEELMKLQKRLEKKSKPKTIKRIKVGKIKENNIKLPNKIP